MGAWFERHQSVRNNRPSVINDRELQVLTGWRGHRFSHCVKDFNGKRERRFFVTGAHGAKVCKLLFPVQRSARQALPWGRGRGTLVTDGQNAAKHTAIEFS